MPSRWIDAPYVASAQCTPVRYSLSADAGVGEPARYMLMIYFS